MPYYVTKRKTGELLIEQEPTQKLVSNAFKTELEAVEFRMRLEFTLTPSIQLESGVNRGQLFLSFIYLN